MKNKLKKYVGKIIRINAGLRGKCIGYSPETGELMYIYEKGGRVASIRPIFLKTCRDRNGMKHQTKPAISSMMLSAAWKMFLLPLRNYLKAERRGYLAGITVRLQTRCDC